MATTRTPAAKTTAAKRTTTRRKTTPKVDVQAPSVQVITPVVTETQQQAMLEAYHALKSNGLPIPTDLLIVEQWLAELNAQREVERERLEAEAKQREAQIQEANKNGPWYVRNAYPAPFNLRLDRQTESRRIQLKPRGTPGDLHPLKDEDLKDPVLKSNLAIGLIEVIPAGEAAMIIERQTTNLTHRVHTPLQIIRNEKGEMYKQGAVKVEAEFNSQGVTVAHIDPRASQGQLSDRQIQQQATAMTAHQRGPQVATQQTQDAVNQATSVVHSGFVPTGGNQAIVQYGPLGDNAQARVIDDIARRKDVQGPAAGLGGIQVVVDPVVRT